MAINRSFGPGYGPGNVVELMFTELMLKGDHKFSGEFTARRVEEGISVEIPGFTARHTHRTDGWTRALLDADDGSATVMAGLDDRGILHVQVTASSAEGVAEIETWTESLEGESPSNETPDIVEMGFWYYSSQGGARRQESDIDAPKWDEIRRNYEHGAAKNIDELMNLTPADITGRLLLLHGSPGTGKTTSLRSLARAWRNWCQIDLVLDPEVMFQSVDYLMAAASGVKGRSRVVNISDDYDDLFPAQGDIRPVEQKWRLLVLEDTDELLRADSKSSTGQGLARLLNLTDGLLGQGRKALIAITTNEDVKKFHPAIVRPGRCLRNIEVPPMGRVQAAEWLNDAGGARVPLGKIKEQMTLAELYALRGNATPTVPEAEKFGQYL
jgi:MoxR-like ATPase